MAVKASLDLQRSYPIGQVIHVPGTIVLTNQICVPEMALTAAPRSRHPARPAATAVPSDPEQILTRHEARARLCLAGLNPDLAAEAPQV
jgi:hypothetical protein